MYVASSITFCYVSYRCDREGVWQFGPFLLHKMLEKSFSCCVIWEWEIEFFLSKWLDKLFIHLPRLVCRPNHRNAILLFQHFFLVFGENLFQLSEVWSCSSPCSFLLLFLSFEDLFNLIQVNNSWREGFGHIEGHSQHLVQLFLIINFWLKSQRR